VLNEVLARNQRAAVSPWGNYADFVELFNASGSAVEVGGLGIGRSSAANQRWIIPPGVTIPANGYLVIWCDGSARHPRARAVRSTPDSICPATAARFICSTPSANRWTGWNTVFKLRTCPSAAYRGPTGNCSRRHARCGQRQRRAFGAVTALRINEWMAAPLSGDDWFELYNPGALPVALGGLFVTDDPSVTGHRASPIAPLSFIGGRKWVQFIASGSKSAGRNHTAFALAKDGETLRLYDANTNLIDAVDFGLQADGVSQGRLPDGAGNIVSLPPRPRRAARTICR
jgi:hypothetical protein